MRGRRWLGLGCVNVYYDLTRGLAAALRWNTCWLTCNDTAGVYSSSGEINVSGVSKGQIKASVRENTEGAL